MTSDDLTVATTTLGQDHLSFTVNIKKKGKQENKAEKGSVLGVATFQLSPSLGWAPLI